MFSFTVIELVKIIDLIDSTRTQHQNNAGCKTLLNVVNSVTMKIALALGI